MKKLTLLLLLILFGVSESYSQRTITGVITGEKNEHLLGATILFPGASTGTLSDENGQYTILIPGNTGSLRFSYIGYIPQQIELNESEIIDVNLKVDIVGLEDILVIGYTPQKRKDITGAVSSVNMEDIKLIPAVGVEDALQGRATGVMVTNQSGAPGSQAIVRIRGNTSIAASNDPLYVLDGVPVIARDFGQVAIGGQGTNSLTDLNPHEIESIEVLKDASTAAMYGTRAANGVVLITTKKGIAGRTKINFDASFGVQQAAKKIPMMSAEQYRDQMELFFGNKNAGVGGMGGNTDWQDEVFQPSPIQNYTLSISGGEQKTRFFTLFSYLDEQGIMKGTGLRRYNARLNLDHDASDKFSFGIKFGYGNSILDRNESQGTGQSVLLSAIWTPATVPIFNDDGTYVSVFGLDNPVMAAEQFEIISNSHRVNGNVFGKFKIIDGLEFKAAFGLDALFYKDTYFYPSTSVLDLGGLLINGNTKDISWLSEYTLNYQKAFGKHNINGVLGLSFQEEKIERENAWVSDLPTDDFRALSTGSSILTVSGDDPGGGFYNDFLGDGLQSYFGNFIYTYNNKYILTAIFRADGSSRFVDNQFGYFPAFSGAWRISNEGFFSSSWIDDLKLRLSWGKTGNNSIGPFAARGLYFGGNNYQETPGIAPGQIGNKNLKWETTTQTNAGFDFSFFDYRLSGSIDFYIKNTDDLLLERPLPLTSGFEFVLENIGEVRNSGVELNIIGFPIVRKNFQWKSAFNIAYNKNEVIKLRDGLTIIIGNFDETLIMEGQPMGSFYGYVTDGLFQNQQEINDHPVQPGAEPGDIRFKDLNNDGIIDDSDQTILGHGNPEIIGGFNNTLSYKGFELNLFFQFAARTKIANFNAYFSECMCWDDNTTRQAWEGRWQKAGDMGYPRAVKGDPNGNTRVSDRWIEDGSYLRLKTASIAYTFPKSTFKKVIKNLRLYILGQNLYTFTNYSWFDPEVSNGSLSNVMAGRDFYTPPQARSLIFGLNVTF